MAEEGHLLHVFPSFAVGGPELRTCDIINHFGRSYRHTVIPMNGDTFARERIKKEIRIEYVTLDFEKKTTLRNITLFRKRLKKIRPDVLLTYNWGTIEWAMANSLFPFCPQIHAEDGFGADEIEKQKTRRVLFRRIFLSRAFRVIVPSQNLLHIAHTLWKLSEKRVQYIPNGIDCKAIAGTSSKRTESRITIGTVATLRKEKNVERLLRIFSLLPKESEALLWIVGDGPEFKNLEKKVKELGIAEKTKLWGYHNHPAELLKNMDIFAISSDTEQMPISVLEAMAADCPIISTDVGDVKNMVCDENRSFVIKKENEDAYGKILLKLISDEALRKRLGRKNREKCQNIYDKEIMFQAYKDLYDSAIQGSNQANG